MTTVYAEALRRQTTFSAWWTSDSAVRFQLLRWRWLRELAETDLTRTEDHLAVLNRRCGQLREAIDAGVEPPPDAIPGDEEKAQAEQWEEDMRRHRELVAVAHDDEEKLLLADDPAGYLRGRADGLRRARAYYVTEQMVDLVNAAYYSRPAEDLRPDHLPCPSGFMWLESPAVYTYGAGHSALQWEPSSWLPPGARDREPAVRVTAWLTNDCLREDLRDHAVEDWGSYSPWSFIWPLGRDAAVEEVVDRDFAHCSRWAQAAWSLMQQQLASVAPGPVDRHARKRAVREDVTPEVTVVTLRAAKHAPREGEPRRVDWRGRWLVRGFWRNQWYPSTQEHRPIWIDDYVKGPEDRPFLVRERVTVWRR